MGRQRHIAYGMAGNAKHIAQTPRADQAWRNASARNMSTAVSGIENCLLRRK